MARSLLSAVLSIGGAKFATVFIGALTTPILVRLLGPADYGRYAVVLSTFAFANMVMSSGTNDAVRKFISERADSDWQNAVFGSLAQLAVILAIAVAFVIFLATNLGVVEWVFGPQYVTLFYLLSIFVIGRQLRDYPLRTLMGIQAELYSEPLKILQKVLYALLAIAAAYLGYSVEGVLVADIITSTVVATAAIVLLSRKIEIRSAFTAPSVSLPAREMYRYIAGTIVFFGLLTSLYHVDILFLQAWVAEESVGYYKGALVLAEILWIAPAAMQLALLQRVSGLWDDNALDEIQRQASKVTRFALLFTILVTIGMAALASDFVPMYYGEDFTPAVTPLLLLLPGVVGFSAARPTLAINQGRRSLRPLIVATSGCAAVNIILNALLIPEYGMVGAAVATSIGYGSLVFFQAAAARHVGYTPFRDLPYIRIAATAGIAAIPIFGLSWLIDSRVLALAIVSSAGFVVFWAAAVATGAVQYAEIEPAINRVTDRVR